MRLSIRSRQGLHLSTPMAGAWPLIAYITSWLMYLVGCFRLPDVLGLILTQSTDARRQAVVMKTTVPCKYITNTLLKIFNQHSP